MIAVVQPSGTVTLVFSDIEGSTKLLHELGAEAYREALAEHRAIVREAYSRYSGYEVDYEGDAFFYAFSSAADAVNAVSEAMQGLDGGPIRIRVGIHTGEPVLDPPKYVGMDVHFAARVMATAHGGQVVCSAATRDALDPSNSLLQALSSLGSHRLKDIAEPVSLFQLGEGSFPALKTIANSNLPSPASSFLGREDELYQAAALLQQTRPAHHPRPRRPGQDPLLPRARHPRPRGALLRLLRRRLQLLPGEPARPSARPADDRADPLCQRATRPVDARRSLSSPAGKEASPLPRQRRAPARRSARALAASAGLSLAHPAGDLA